jgi:periplasmic protein TonB
VSDPEQVSNGTSTRPGTPAERRPRPAVVLPRDRERRRGGAVVSILIHALIIFLLIGPLALTERDELIKIEQGAGGPGPTGGGGGGHRGTGGVQEHVAFIQPVTPKPQVVPQLVPPKPVVPPPVPVVKPPDPVPVTPLPPVEEQKTEIKVETAPAVVAQISSLVNGTGGGSGNDGSRGAGPGSGGGVGSGIGTGRGSSVGPGTGGGTQKEYPPQPISLFIPPMPFPKNVHGATVTATFDIDSTGHVLHVDATTTHNKDYDKLVLSVLQSFEFRPGTMADGTPIRMKFQMTYSIGQLP